MRFGTFSLVARDPESGALGVAVAGKSLALGAAPPYAMAGVGTIATQPTFGPRGLAIPIKAALRPLARRYA